MKQKIKYWGAVPFSVGETLSFVVFSAIVSAVLFFPEYFTLLHFNVSHNLILLTSTGLFFLSTIISVFFINAFCGEITKYEEDGSYRQIVTHRVNMFMCYGPWVCSMAISGFAWIFVSKFFV